MSVTPGVNFFELTELPIENPPEVTFLEKTAPVRGSTESGPEQRRGDTTSNPDDNSETRSIERREIEGEQGTTEKSNIGAERMDYRSNTEDASNAEMHSETASQTRSTLPQALYCLARVSDFLCPRDSSNESNESRTPVDGRPTPLASTSRAIIKQCFTETNPIVLPPGHPTVVFNRKQISSILRIVADESAQASVEMLNSVVQRASQLSLHNWSKTPPKGRAQRSLAADTDTDDGINSFMTSDVQGKSSSQGFTSDPDSPHDFQSSVNFTSPPNEVATGSRDPWSTPL